MKKHALPTVSIGIPAHNEAGNIENMLRSVFAQKGEFVLEKVLVLCDGCTDNTRETAEKLCAEFPQLLVKEDGKRVGKAERLNEIHRWNTSDFIGTFDADIVLDGTHNIQAMLDLFAQDPKTLVVAGRLIPVPLKSFFGKISRVSYLSFEDAVLQLHDGNNYYCLVGAVSLLRGSFAQSIEYPQAVISDMNFLYTLATREYPLGVRLAKNTRFLMKTVSTFHDWRLLGLRSVAENKNDVVKYFGEGILKEYHMPKSLSLRSQFKWLLKHPILMSGSILMNIFIRLFPLKKKMPSNGIWETTGSSKTKIEVAQS